MKPVLTNRCAERIVAHVSARTRVDAADILSRSRHRLCVIPRHRAMRIMTRLGYSSSDIGLVFSLDGSAVRQALRARA